MPEDTVSTAKSDTLAPSETIPPTDTSSPAIPKPVDQTPKPSVRIEKIDAKTARKIDITQSVTVLNVDDLRKMKDDLESELGVKQKMLQDINEVIDAFDNQS